MYLSPNPKFDDICDPRIADGVDNFWCEPHLVVWTTFGVHHN